MRALIGRGPGLEEQDGLEPGDYDDGTTVPETGCASIGSAPARLQREIGNENNCFRLIFISGFLESMAVLLK